LLSLIAVAVLASACTEKLTTPADCPALCPGGSAEFRDTVLTATVGLDTSFSGYVSGSSLISLLVSTGGAYGDSRAVVRFNSRGDSVLVRDTLRTFTVDSMAIGFFLQRSDSTVTGDAVEIYRLPIDIDSTATIAELDAAMTPERLLQEFPISATFRSGPMRIFLQGADLAKVAFTPADTTRLVIGLRLRSAGASGARIGASAAGNEGPSTTWFTTANIADTALQKQTFNRLPTENFTVRSIAPGSGDGLLSVGGYPVSRSFITFTLPPALRDSVSIIRATLQLTTDQPLFGIPADTATILARPVLANLGAKSPVAGDLFAGGFLLPGQSDISIEVADLIRTWQGSDALPPILRLEIGEEGGTFIAPFFRSTRSPTGMPTLRITYRRTFAFEGF
jgi:hypothetical protein